METSTKTALHEANWLPCFNFAYIILLNFKCEDMIAGNYRKSHIFAFSKEVFHIISFEPISEMVDIKIFSRIQCEFSKERCDWQILAGNDRRIVSKI